MNSLSLKDFSYTLPESQIPAFPLEQRDSARLLMYQKGNISHHIFRELSELIPPKSSLIFNTTRVIPARLFFHRITGAKIEVLLLEPVEGQDIHQSLQSSEDVVWKTMIGGLKKWKDDEVLQLDLGATVLEARIKNREKAEVNLHWNGPQSMSEILELAGQLPLPPYLKRETKESDKNRYQTVYAENEGAVAAPTAGLHFTDEVLDHLKKNHIQRIDLTLHVGAGTFKPVKAEDPRDHEMHLERMEIPFAAIESLIASEGPLIAVGTTSMRSMESLYWWGCALLDDPDCPFFVRKLQPYTAKKKERKKALNAVLKYMERHQIEVIKGSTEILIYPSYTFSMCDGLITNFHLPETTLIMLVAAFIGEDWKRVYETALLHKYRFLSFGDSSLLLP
ncbi:MAG: S-adenosylmethionine:tRNA ribosyltransferase-isomerase [Bacteroidetes bacterium]|nr:S-adenosylmethionine:tRNA ribosyltransferase-isomerase [Bacteroidota bacterium]